MGSRFDKDFELIVGLDMGRGLGYDVRQHEGSCRVDARGHRGECRFHRPGLV